MRVLVIGADPETKSDLEFYLSEHGHCVFFADAFELSALCADLKSFDLILLDQNLPAKYEMEFPKYLRDRGFCGGVIVISIVTAVPSSIASLDAGADYYLVSPFDIDLLLARIRAFARRHQDVEYNHFCTGDLKVDLRNSLVTFRDIPLPFTPMEYRLLVILLRNAPTFLSARQLMNMLWPHGETPMESTVKGHVKGLRRKLIASGCNIEVETKYGFGYRIKPNKDDTTSD